MGGLFGIGGSGAKTDRVNQLTSFSELKNLFNFGLPQVESAIGKGTSELSTAGDYWKKILSGNRAGVEQAVAPETNIARSEADARKRQLGTMGTARGGGTAATSQKLDSETAAKIDNLIFGARPEAAKETAKIGQAEAGIGTSLFGTAETSASDLGQIATASKKGSDANAQAQGEAAAQILMAALAFE